MDSEEHQDKPAESKVLQRRISYERYFLAASITILFYIAGIIAGLYVAEKRIDSLTVSTKAISALLELSELKDKLSKNETAHYCNLSWNDVWKEKVEIGSILASLENRLGKEDKKVVEQKIIYTKVQTKTLKLVEKINSECKYNWTIILFFYTNNKNDEKGDYKISEYQGYALDTLYSSNPEKIKVFSFDINIQEGSSQELIKQYNITSVPALVINGIVYREFLSRARIESVLKENGN